MNTAFGDKLEIIGLVIGIAAGFSTLASTWRLAGRREAIKAKLSGKYAEASADLEERGGGGDPKAGDPDSLDLVPATEVRNGARPKAEEPDS